MAKIKGAESNMMLLELIKQLNYISRVIFIWPQMAFHQFVGGKLHSTTLGAKFWAFFLDLEIGTQQMH
jgi:hypothetical protein